MIFTNINKFHKFLCLFEVRINTCKFGPNWGKSQAGRPTPATFCHEISRGANGAQGQVIPRWVLQIS